MSHIVDFLRFGRGLPSLGEAEESGRVEGPTDTQPRRGVVDETDFGVAAPTCRVQVLGKAPFVEVGFGAFNSAFFEYLGAKSFGVRQVKADADEETLVVVGASRKSPGFGTSSVTAFLALPDVALWHGADIIWSKRVYKIGPPGRIDVIREGVL